MSRYRAKEQTPIEPCKRRSSSPRQGREENASCSPQGCREPVPSERGLRGTGRALQPAAHPEGPGEAPREARAPGSRWEPPSSAAVTPPPHLSGRYPPPPSPQRPLLPPSPQRPLQAAARTGRLTIPPLRAVPPCPPLSPPPSSLRPAAEPRTGLFVLLVKLLNHVAAGRPPPFEPHRRGSSRRKTRLPTSKPGI